MAEIKEERDFPKIGITVTKCFKDNCPYKKSCTHIGLKIKYPEIHRKFVETMFSAIKD